MTDQYAVFGNPINHSRSPQIHQMFAQQTGEDINYSRQRVEPGHFNQAADEFFAQGGKGLNITLPFKQDAFKYADRLTSRAATASAVNTLALQEDNTLLGDNTDGVGLVRDMLNNLDWTIKAKKILMLGAGGAVRGVLEPIFAEQPASITIVNRTALKATDLVREFSQWGNIMGGGYELLAGHQFDLIINGTSTGLSGELPPLPEGLVSSRSCCYDMMYGAKPTVFMTWAQQQQAGAVADGLGMLVEQAAQSFFLWRNKMPETEAVITMLRNQLIH